MKLPALCEFLEEVDSTQAVCGRRLAAGEPVGTVIARDQTEGRGRFGRTWQSQAGQSLTMSIAFTEYADSESPWLIGMAVACACAEVLGCQVRWPNDLAAHGSKLGGILTELLPDHEGRRIPVVGIGINVGQIDFPADLTLFATSCALIGLAKGLSPEQLASEVVEGIRAMPEPVDWAAIAPYWGPLDATAGKRYRLPNGTEGVALRVGAMGQLVCRVGSTEVEVLAAEALM